LNLLKLARLLNNIMMKIKQTIIDMIVAHSKKELPNEACGYLSEKNSIVCQHYELTNVDRATDHFAMDPKEQFAAVKEMRHQGMKLCAVYHSHPDTPARPSAEDIQLAYDPTIRYVIVSLANDHPSVKAFQIRKAEVKPEPIEIVD